MFKKILFHTPSFVMSFVRSFVRSFVHQFFLLGKYQALVGESGGVMGSGGLNRYIDILLVFVDPNHAMPDPAV